MALPVSFFNMTINDSTFIPRQESTNTSLPITTLTAGNVAAQQTLLGNLVTALSDVIIGLFAKTETVYNRVIITSDPAGSTLAQRENKWLMRYHGVTLNQKFQASIGTADLTLLAGGSEFLALGSGAGAALKTAFEAVVKSPDDAAEAVVLDSVQFVSRNT